MHNAVRIHEVGGPDVLRFEEVDVGDPGPEQLRIRQHAAGVNFIDVYHRTGLYPQPLPFIPGQEGAGVVEAVGDQVVDLKPGDHVISCVSGFCGACKWCLTGRAFLCDKVGLSRSPEAPPRLTRDGDLVWPFMDLASFAEQLLVHEHLLVKVHPDMPLDKAALIGCGVTTGVGAVINTAGVRPGDTVAVIGCGGIGLNAIQAAAICGASRVIAVDRVASKLELARTFGATDTVDASATDAVAAVVELTAGGVDHAIEAIGLKSTAEQAFLMVGKGGTATIIGMVPMGQVLEIDPVQLLGGKRLQGSNMGSNRFRVDMPQYVDWYLAGKLKLDELVSGTMPLERINDGFAAFATGEVARQLIVFD